VYPASLQTFIDTRLILKPSVIPNSNYVIMGSDWNCLKHFRVFLYYNHHVHRGFLITLYYCCVLDGICWLFHFEYWNKTLCVRLKCYIAFVRSYLPTFRRGLLVPFSGAFIYSSWTVWPLKIGLTDRPEKSVIYKPTLCKIPKERRRRKASYLARYLALSNHQFEINVTGLEKVCNLQ
jgi:hypothetical protein